MIQLPTWWTNEDEALCNKFHEWQEMDSGNFDENGYSTDPEKFAHWNIFLKDDWKNLNCRRCEYWKSSDGKNGECQGPELACGNTRHMDQCEQWSPRPEKILTTRKNHE